MQIPWLFPIFIFSLTFDKIPWLFPDFCQVWNFPDFSLTAGHPAIVLTSFIDVVFVLSTSLPVAWITNGLQPDEKHGIELLIFNGYWTATAEMPTFLTSPQLGSAHHMKEKNSAIHWSNIWSDSWDTVIFKILTLKIQGRGNG